MTTNGTNSNGQRLLTDSLYFVDVIALDNFVEFRVELVQELDDLKEEEENIRPSGLYT